MYIVGLMSGTSADGIDAALVNIKGTTPELHVDLIKHITLDYEPSLRAEIFACFRPETGTVDRVCRLNVALGEAYAAAVLNVIAVAGFTPEMVDLVASHGQTIWYELPGVLALGEPAVIAERTGITTISNFRARDIAAGGRGAPLVSYLDWLLFRHSDYARAIVNIGGIGNLTALPPLNSTADPLTFDSGPGNMLIDYCTNRATNGLQAFDRDGQFAARGTVNAELLSELMAHPYIAQPPPKTTGRELFGAQFGAQLWDRAQTPSLSSDDLIATVTAFTAKSIAAACKNFLPFPIDELYVAGGGSFNPTLLSMLQAEIRPASVHIHDELGIPAAAKECILFAVLGYETWHGRPGALPVFTGAARPTILGSITPGRLKFG